MMKHEMRVFLRAFSRVSMEVMNGLIESLTEVFGPVPVTGTEHCAGDEGFPSSIGGSQGRPTTENLAVFRFSPAGGGCRMRGCDLLRRAGVRGTGWLECEGVQRGQRPSSLLKIR